ncbi:32703_t:CDS:2, partial [Gigaspora margarita]
PDIPEKPGYREWIASSNLNLSPIEVEILDFFKGYSSDDSDDFMVIESNEIPCEYFDGQNVNSSNGKSLDFFYLDDYKCRFCKRYICNCWNSFSSIDNVDSDFDYD